MTDKPSSWSDDDIETVRRMWAKGASAGEIAKAIGHSRNAILGKVHRMDLAARPSPIKPSTKPRKRRLTKAERDAIAQAARWGERQGSCQWPVGDPPQFICEGVPIAGKPYCADHCRKAYAGYGGGPKI